MDIFIVNYFILNAVIKRRDMPSSRPSEKKIKLLKTGSMDDQFESFNWLSSNGKRLSNAFHVMCVQELLVCNIRATRGYHLGNAIRYVQVLVGKYFVMWQIKASKTNDIDGLLTGSEYNSTVLCKILGRFFISLKSS